MSPCAKRYIHQVKNVNESTQERLLISGQLEFKNLYPGEQPAQLIDRLDTGDVKSASTPVEAPSEKYPFLTLNY